ncbi:hypothetical protein C8R47DRAFT_1158701 [Mycena vitilis]|nr:hypothetical protein C8R47DRAFT_1158701 [Mycena vitilis]
MCESKSSFLILACSPGICMIMLAVQACYILPPRSRISWTEHTHLHLNHCVRFGCRANDLSRRVYGDIPVIAPISGSRPNNQRTKGNSELHSTLTASERCLGHHSSYHQQHCCGWPFDLLLLRNLERVCIPKMGIRCTDSFAAYYK